MKTLTALIILSLGLASVAGAQPAPIGGIVITEHAIRQATPAVIRAPAVLASSQAQSVSSPKARAAAAIGLGFAGFLLGSWLGQAIGGGGDRGLDGAFIGAGAGALVGVVIAIR